MSHSSTDAQPQGAASRAMAWLMGAGLLPFVAALGYASSGRPDALAGVIVFELYAAVILSFLGGMRWGRALASGEPAVRLVEAILPSLLAFAALLLLGVAQILAVAVTGAGFAIWLLRDARDPAWPPVFRHRRVVVSLLVLLLHLGLAWLLYARRVG